MTLQLAEGPATLAEAVASEFFINVPDPVSGQIIRVREDYFDTLPWDQWSAVMDAIQPYNEGMNGLFSGLKQRMADRREQRAENKALKQEQKTERTAIRMGALQNIGQAVGGLITGRSGQPDFGAEMPGHFPITGGVNFGTPAPQRVWYENPWIIGGISATGLLAIYLLTRKRK